MFNLRYLRFFYDAAITQSVTEASLRNFVSQSALSQGISKLEKSLGAALTTHERKRFELTQEGKVILQYARKIFEEVDLLLDHLEKKKEVLCGSIDLITTNSLARALLPNAILKAKQTYPELAIHFHRGSRQHIKKALDKKEVDLALALMDPLFEEYDHHLLFTGAFRLYTSSSVQKENTTVYVDHLEDPAVEMLKKKLDKKMEFKQLSGWGMVELFVKKGLGWGLLPDVIALYDEKTPLQPLPISISNYALCAFYPRKQIPHRVRSFVDLLCIQPGV